MTNYEVLGTRRGAAPQEIDEAYENLLAYLKLEDESTTSEERRTTLARERAEIDAAHGVLSDPDLRRDYDRELGCPNCGGPLGVGDRCPPCEAPPSPANDAQPVRFPDLIDLAVHPVPIEEPAPSEGRTWILAAPAFLLAIGLVVAGWTMIGSEAGSAAEVDDSRVADGWDPRVSEFVSFVETKRGLEFEHPVPVEFLSEEEFTRRVTEDGGESTEEEAEALADWAASLRALGLVEGELDLAAVADDFAATGILGRYEPETGHILVRGTELTPEVETTLVHELTHALQDQHFDISDERLEGMDGEGARTAFQALVEGDASRIESLYVDQMSDGDRAELDASMKSGVAEMSSRGIPEVFTTLVSAPYGLGESFLALLEAVEGTAAVDDAFRAPPDTEEHLLDPWAYLDGERSRGDVRPEPPPDVDVLYEGDFGALTWLLMLAERIDPMMAFDAVDGWGGDAYALYSESGRTCVAATFAGDTPADAGEMATALRRWAAAMPAGTAVVEARGETSVLLRSCDPGPSAALRVTGNSRAVVELAVARSYVSSEATEIPGLGPEGIRCYGNEFIRAIEFGEFRALVESTEPGDDGEQLVVDAARAAAGACGIEGV